MKKAQIRLPKTHIQTFPPYAKEVLATPEIESSHWKAYIIERKLKRLLEIMIQEGIYENKSYISIFRIYEKKRYLSIFN